MLSTPRQSGPLAMALCAHVERTKAAIIVRIEFPLRATSLGRVNISDFRKGTPIPTFSKRAKGACSHSRCYRLLSRAVAPLFLFAGIESWLPPSDLSARRRCNYLDLLFFGLLGLSIASLLTFCHAEHSLRFDDAVTRESVTLMHSGSHFLPRRRSRRPIRLRQF